ncbi:MAG: hypothetical protein WC875_01975 [Candidatus Absconditabacterales bacterium]
MRKLPVKIIGLVALGIVSVGSLFTFGQVPSQGLDFSHQYQGANPTLPGSTVAPSTALITTIQKVINWALGLLALIALILLIWGGFQMVTAAGDETKYKKGFKILQQAAIGLIFIGASWLIISLIFRIIQNLF